MDDELLTAMKKEGVNTWFMGSKGMDQSTVKHDFGWGSPKFHKMGRDKIRLIRDFTELGLDVLISDIDVAWLKDPLPYFTRFPTADMLVSTDQLRNETGGDALEFHICQTASNIGIMWIRSTPGTQELTRKWVEVIENNPKEWDQVAFNNLKTEGNSCSGRRDANGLMLAFSGKVRMGILPVVLFSNGHTFYVQKLHHRLQSGLEPYAVHATFQYGGTPGKRHRMREALVWQGDRPTYFRHDPGFLSYTPHIPSDLDLAQFQRLGFPSKDSDHKTLTPDSPQLHAHMGLVNFQLHQMRHALAIAWLLGRKLVAPKFLCGLDRVWFPHYGVFPGSFLKLPFECPLDHVINIEHIFRRARGDNLPFKEHSFLSNPLLIDPPNATNLVFVRPEILSLNIIPAFGIPRWTSSFPEKILKLPLTKEYVTKELGLLHNVKYLHLTNVVKAFTGLADPSKQRHFTEATFGDSSFGDAWCCTARGNMRYDFVGQS
eukprot:CAMPEP_0196588754 /NCGR_PEP_ID=MMETSP1081-20130531/61632_1 /TAXON_ID=36882 /ORGANISM="Pyramimonas amylifera, Strain CCMP720" /LENGTH=486 /DNA_ID=CAMNT_0041911357 /DNA_START=350 /DNA_END=1810 /DNA_ORIENTATION=+